MRRWSLLLFVGVAACNARPTAAPGLAEAGVEVNCIDLSRVAGRRVVPPSAVEFDVVGGATYRNQLQGSCPGAARADPSAIIEAVSQTGRLCRDDRIRIYDRVEAQATGSRSFPICRLGSFTAVPTR